MATSSVVSCAQCPTCKTHVPIPPDLLRRLNPRHIIKTQPNTIAEPISAHQFQIANSTLSINAGDASHHTNTAQVALNGNRGSLITTSAYSLSHYENSWRSKFWKMLVLIHGIVELVLTILIIILEMASLGVSVYSATGAGIWCGISFAAASVLTILLAQRWDCSRIWATRVLIAQIVLLVFSYILIGIVGNFVSSYGYILTYGTSSYYTTTYGDNFPTKYKIMQAQLAFAILLMFCGVAYVIFYGVVTYLALWKPFQTLDTPHLFRE